MKLKYPEYLKDYAEKHKLKEFADINPLLETFTDDSNKIVLKIDIESTCTLAKLMDLKESLSTILGIKRRALRILDVKDGCVQATFLIPAHIAAVIFASGRKFTLEEEEKFQALSIVWLEYKDTVFIFREDHFIINHQKMDQIQSTGMCSTKYVISQVITFLYHRSQDHCLTGVRQL